VLHAALAVALVLGARAWSQSQPKTYVVNLVPAVAAVGSPQGRPALPPRPQEARPEPSPPPDLPQRQVARETAPPEMPARTRAPLALPDRDRVLPPRPSAIPRAGDKELPALASPAPRVPPAPPAERALPEGPRAAPTPAPLGRRDGAPGGSGPMTLNVTDFPFAWYLSRVQAKVTERWAGKAIPGQQPVAMFEIHRDGRVSGLTIERPSGNPYYDQAALRAITEAAPFPPLPQEYAGQVLRVHLGFNFSAERG
jgi:protein TonB